MVLACTFIQTLLEVIFTLMKLLLKIFTVVFILFTEWLIPATTLANVKNILGNQGSSTLLTFRAPLGVDASLISCEWRHNGITVSINVTKYIHPTPRSLRINNIVGDDEGNYACHYYHHQLAYSETVASINVIGVATFAQPQENLTIHVGGTAQLDTRVTFVGGGAQQHKQKVMNLLQLFKDGRQVYRCRNWSVYATLLCTSEGKFAIAMQGSDMFDFYLSMSNVTINDSGSYVAKLEVIHPETGSYSSIQKTITLTVEVVNVELPELDEESFQLCIGPFFLSDCSALAVDSQKGLQLESEIRSEIVQNVRRRCPHCVANGSSVDLIQPGKLRCSETAARLIYRSTIEATGSHNASEIIGVIEKWVTSTESGEATLHLWPFVMDLDSQCPVSITSLDAPYPVLGAGGDQVQFSRVKDHIDSCLSIDNLQTKNT